jgi:hypothetical protein
MCFIHNIHRHVSADIPATFTAVVEVRMHAFLTYAPDRGELSTLFLGKDPLYLLNKRLGELQRWSDYFVVETNLLVLREIKLRFLARPSHSA